MGGLFHFRFNIRQAAADRALGQPRRKSFRFCAPNIIETTARTWIAPTGSAPLDGYEPRA